MVNDIRTPAAPRLVTPAPAPAPARVAAQPRAVEYLDVDSVVELIANAEFPFMLNALRGVRKILEGLATQPGDSWTEKWQSAGCPDSGENWASCIGDPWSDASSRRRSYEKSGGLSALVAFGVLQPDYVFLSKVRVKLHWVREHRNPGLDERFTAFCNSEGLSPTEARNGLRVLGKLMASRGKNFEELGVEDLVEFNAVRGERRNELKSMRTGVSFVLDYLRTTGNVDPSIRGMREASYAGQPTVLDIVDVYNIESQDVREMFIRYLLDRQPSLDFVSLRNLAYELLRNFWSDVQENYRGKNSLRLTQEESQGWMDRYRAKDLKDNHRTMFAIRALYLDIANWATDDSYWAVWAAPCFISKNHAAGMGKHKRRVQAENHQRTRALSPEMPGLMDSVERDRLRHAALLAMAKETAGEEFEFEGVMYRSPVFRAHSRTTWIQVVGTSRRVDQSYAEHRAFWSWAVVNVLRHTGVRIEELVELTATAISSYRLPETGEVLPLLQIVPSKTDSERIFLISPELAHVLAEVRFRVRAGRAEFPLATRYDPAERVFSPALPFLFQTTRGRENRVFATPTVSGFIRYAFRVSLEAQGRPVPRLTAHDFRRLFATDSLSAGLPIHILAKLMGHARISTTQGYAAVFDDDVIRHFRDHLSHRRSMRPAEDYREPGAGELAEFHAHFMKRKVELGTCSRAYGTPCVHEHACVRCPMLRPDPAQRRRLEEIQVNLTNRRVEAQNNGWLGELEGIDISLRSAAEKLETMTRITRLENPTLRRLDQS